ncbi:MAG TPA: Gfo/Idh/MocA family oxidoreductase [Polyangiaceae bacterium]|nr:Gfo/Idh/MocA family oxidoreductase [Polyangiaceae bacterium]
MVEEKSGDKPVRWGVLGASHFALMAAIPGMQKAPLVRVSALASRSLDKAQQAARQANVPRAYGSYEELIADPEIEAIYNPLPNNLHVAWSIRAARAGKHVLCEKPIALTAAEAAQLYDVQRETGKLVAEAFMVRYHPQWELVTEKIQSGRIGKVRAVQTAFSYSNSDLDNIRNQKDVGGGALYDIGGYAINTARLIFGTEPKRVAAVCERDAQSGCDILSSAILDFAPGQATFVVGTQHVPYQRVQIFGTAGHIEVEIPFNAPHDRGCKVWVDSGFVGSPDFTVAKSSNEVAELFTTEPANHYTRQSQLFSEAIRSGKPVHNDMQSAVSNMRVIDALFKAAQSGRWEDV